MAAELHVVLLRVHVAGVEEDRQAEWLQGVQMLPPRVIVELQSKRQGVIVREVQHLGGGVRHICEAYSEFVTSSGARPGDRSLDLLTVLHVGHSVGVRFGLFGLLVLVGRLVHATGTAKYTRPMIVLWRLSIH